jgi:hypothetical protein
MSSRELRCHLVGPEQQIYRGRKTDQSLQEWRRPLPMSVTRARCRAAFPRTPQLQRLRASLTCMILVPGEYGNPFIPKLHSTFRSLFSLPRSTSRLPTILLSQAIGLVSNHSSFFAASIRLLLTSSAFQSPSLGNFPIWPQAGCPGDVLNNCKFPKVDRISEWINGSVIAKPGYFSIMINTSIQAEMTVTEHTALYRFTFPSNVSGNSSATTSGHPLILLDLADLPNSRSNATVWVDSNSGRITATGTFSPSFGIGYYDTHVCVDFSGGNLRDTGVWINNRAGSQPKTLSVTPDGINNQLPAGSWSQFTVAEGGEKQIMARVGMSFKSVEQACGNAENEIPDYDFAGIREAAEAAWRNKLNVVSVNATGVSDELQTTFWSGMYRAMFSPQDYTGENPLWDSDEPYYDSYYWYEAPSPYLGYADVFQHMGFFPKHPSPADNIRP